MSISPPPFSPPRSELSDDENNHRYLKNDDDEDDDEYIDSPRSLISSFDLYKNAIDRLRSSITNQTIEEQKSSLEAFKPLTTRSNAWLYMRIHDDLFSILLEYLVLDDLAIQSTVLSIFANIACERSSHEQIFETNVIDIVCGKVLDIDLIDITNRCFRLLGNICSFEDAARKMIDADLTRAMGNVLRTCSDAACLHSIIRCSRKLCTYSFCRDRMLDSMCLLSICKQLFAEKVALRKEAMKAVLEWDIENSDRSRSQLREGEIFRFLISTIEAQSDKEYRHLAFRLLNNLLRHSDMRTEFGLRNGLDFLLKMITTHQYQSRYEHLKFLGLFCVCCQEALNRRLIKEDLEKLKLFFNYLDKYQYRSNFLDLLLTAIGQFIYDETSLMIFVKQMQFIERMTDLLETVILVKYENNNEIDSQRRKRLKTTHTTEQTRQSVAIEFNEVLFTEFVENTHLDDERQTSNPNETLSKTLNIEIRRRTEGLIFTLLSKLSYEATDRALRRYLYNPRLISLLLRYIHLCDEPNPRAIRILSRLTKMIDCSEYLLDLGLPYLIQSNFYPNDHSRGNYPLSINSDDQYLLNILLNDNRAFFQRLSWTSEQNRLKTIEYSLRKNLDSWVNTPYGLNETIRRLNDASNEEKFQSMLTILSIIKEQHFQSVLFDKCSGYQYLLEQMAEPTCLWAFRTLAHRCLLSNSNQSYIQEYMSQLAKHASNSTVPSNRTIQLNLNNKQLFSANPDLLSHHSEYFKTLFHGPYLEQNQSSISLHLPEPISIECFIYLHHLLSHSDECIEIKHVDNLIHLCDQYLLDYFPYQLVQSLFKQFQNGTFESVEDFLTKPNLISTFIRACLMYLLTNDMSNSQELFRKLMTNHAEEFEKLIRLILKHQCWFGQEDSPFVL